MTDQLTLEQYQALGLEERGKAFAEGRCRAMQNGSGTRETDEEAQNGEGATEGQSPQSDESPPMPLDLGQGRRGEPLRDLTPKEQVALEYQVNGTDAAIRLAEQNGYRYR